MGSHFRPGQRVRPSKVCRRKDDGTLWMPSYPEDWTDGDAVAATLSGDPAFCFRQIILVRRRLLPDAWILTGNVWHPLSGEFTVLDPADAKELAP